MNNLKEKLSEQEKELLKTLLKDKILDLHKGLEFRTDIKEVMNNIDQYKGILIKIS